MVGMIVKKEFYFIRHGQTDYNVSDLTIDHEDVSLNAVGCRQAKEIEPIIAHLPVKTICCSPLKRARETNQIIAARLPAAYHEMPSLSECSFKIWNDMTRCGPHAHLNGGEHVKSFIQRVLGGVNEALLFKSPQLLVAHGGIHWAICCLMAIKDHDWVVGNCLPIHFFPDSNGQWRARKLI